MVARPAGTGMQAAQRHVRRGGNSLITTARLAPVTLLLAAALAAPALAQGGPKPAPTRVPAQTPVLRMSQSPDPTFDEGTIKRMAGAMLSYTALEVQGGWPMLPPSSSKLAPGSTGPDVAALRQRLSITDDLPADQANGEVYDDALAAAVRRFQARHGLDGDRQHRTEDAERAQRAGGQAAAPAAALRSTGSPPWISLSASATWW